MNVKTKFMTFSSSVMNSLIQKAPLVAFQEQKKVVTTNFKFK